MDLEKSITDQYLELKSVFAKDTFQRAYNEEPHFTRINDKIYISSIDQVDAFLEAHPDADGVVSLGKKPVVQVDHFHIDIKDVIFENQSLIINDKVLEDIEKKAQELMERLQGVYGFIKSKKKVLIHCKKGMSRSCFVYLYYELKDHFINYKSRTPILTSLLKLLKFKRSCCMIGDMFILSLCLYQHIMLRNVVD